MEPTDMAATEKARHRRRRMIALTGGGLALLILAVAAALVPSESWAQAKSAAGQAMDGVRRLGAGWFFTAFAVLPAIGFPVSAFAFSAGPLFGPVLGLPTVLALAGLSMAVSLTISYGLARYVLRPWVTRLLGYMGYQVPVVPPDKRKMLTILVRITPGPPYVFQSFLLGLAEVPFGLYLVLSWVISTTNICLVIIFGDALMKGQGKVAFAALAGVVVLVGIVKITRKKLTKS